MKILCTICMRGGSKEIKNKNIKKVNSKYLFEYTLETARKCKLITDIVISTDSRKIYNLTNKFGTNNFFLREKKLSTDNINKTLVVHDALIKSEIFFKKKYDYIIDLSVTSPLRNISDLNKSLKKIIKLKANNLFSVNLSSKNPYFNMVEKKNKTYKLIKSGDTFFSRQKAPVVYSLNASIYIWKRNFLIKNKKIFSNNTVIYEMPMERSLDIDSRSDLDYLKYLLNR